MDHAQLLDERTRPDFREVYGRLASESVALDAAVARVRLGGMDLGDRELAGLERIRLLMSEMNALRLASEAESLGIDPARRAQLSLLSSLLRAGRLCVRIAPLAGWAPDFSLFKVSSQRPPLSSASRDGPILMVGRHWFERPYPHPGPALGVVLWGAAATRAQQRFEEVWCLGHDVRAPIEVLLREALRKTHTRFAGKNPSA